LSFSGIHRNTTFGLLHGIQLMICLPFLIKDAGFVILKSLRPIHRILIDIDLRRDSDLKSMTKVFNSALHIRATTIRGIKYTIYT